jgi:cephalosporin hydroxylase
MGGYMDEKSAGSVLGKPRISRFSLVTWFALHFLIGILVGRIWALRPSALLDQFHIWSYSRTWQNQTWLGVQIGKAPYDTWVYQQIIYETKPDVLIEAGTFVGGSALYFASVFDLVKRGRVLTIDVDAYPGRPQHERITYLLGSSTSDAIFQQVKNSIRPGQRVMVSLDSDHHKDHVLKELKLYSGLVTPGNYLVVEDTDLNGHPVYASFDGSGPRTPGPMEAVEEFLKNNSEFIQDRSREEHGLTLFPGGWLKRVR